METKININENNEANENKIIQEKPESNENINLVENDLKNNNEIEISPIDDNKSSSSKNKKGILSFRRSNYFYTKLGNTYAFFGDKNGVPLIVIGPHWHMYAWFCSIMTLVYCYFLIHFWYYMNFFFKLAGLCSFLTYFISYTYTFLVNPGIPKLDENAILGKPRGKYNFCNKCGIWTSMEKKTDHCYDCNICVEGYDHHCPWTGKCIAKNNTNAFYIFLVSILGAFCFFVTALTHAQHNIYLERKNSIKKFL